MKRILALAAVFTLSAQVALAQNVVDSDGDGVYSQVELTVAFPALTDAVFASMDVDGSGAVDADELQAAIEQGLLGG